MDQPAAVRPRPVELVVRNAAQDAATATSPLGASRLLSLLPATWRIDVGFADGDVTVLVRADDGVTVEQIRRAAERALADPTLAGWRLVSRRGR
ncbi:hypothetical protein [Kitasatospora sp. NPDC058190]|uniref:hypothetical protein n=1 Tax=Kitasatospora sp. NPDC058190 TaxID=3346371 RepID=UPI0036D7E449